MVPNGLSTSTNGDGMGNKLYSEYTNHENYDNQKYICYKLMKMLIVQTHKYIHLTQVKSIAVLIR